MSVLSEEKKQQVIALGKLGWPLRRIEQATGVRRETASAYLKSAGVVVCLTWVGTPSAGKTGHTSDPRLRSKTGHGDPRLYSAFFRKTGRPECPFSSIGKCL